MLTDVTIIVTKARDALRAARQEAAVANNALNGAEQEVAATLEQKNDVMRGWQMRWTTRIACKHVLREWYRRSWDDGRCVKDVRVPAPGRRVITCPRLRRLQLSRGETEPQQQEHIRHGCKDCTPICLIRRCPIDNIK